MRAKKAAASESWARQRAGSLFRSGPNPGETPRRIFEYLRHLQAAGRLRGTALLERGPGRQVSAMVRYRDGTMAVIDSIQEAKDLVRGRLKRNPDKSWHKAKRQDYYKRYADDVRAGHKEGAEFWRGAFVAEAHAMAAEHAPGGIAANPPVISALRKVAAGAPARVKPLAARAILKVYDALAGKSKAAFARLPLRRMGSAAACLARGKRVTL
jgi:hypothetical protein